MMVAFYFEERAGDVPLTIDLDADEGRVVTVELGVGAPGYREVCDALERSLELLQANGVRKCVSVSR